MFRKLFVLSSVMAQVCALNASDDESQDRPLRPTAANTPLNKTTAKKLKVESITDATERESDPDKTASESDSDATASESDSDNHTNPTNPTGKITPSYLTETIEIYSSDSDSHEQQKKSTKLMVTDPGEVDSPNSNSDLNGSHNSGSICGSKKLETTYKTAREAFKMNRDRRDLYSTPLYNVIKEIWRGSELCKVNLWDMRIACTLAHKRPLIRGNANYSSFCNFSNLLVNYDGGDKYIKTFQGKKYITHLSGAKSQKHINRDGWSKLFPMLLAFQKEKEEEAKNNQNNNSDPIIDISSDDSNTTPSLELKKPSKPKTTQRPASLVFETNDRYLNDPLYTELKRLWKESELDKVDLGNVMVTVSSEYNNKNVSIRDLQGHPPINTFSNLLINYKGNDGFISKFHGKKSHFNKRKNSIVKNGWAILFPILLTFQKAEEDAKKNQNNNNNN